MLKLAPSILSADFACLLEDMQKIARGGADYIHVDVMDGHFVPNISFGAPVMKALNGKTSLPYDVHLMIEAPDQYIDSFVTPQTAYITVHQEACVHLHRTIQNIHAKGVKAGVAINPATPVITSVLHLGGCGSGAGDVGQSGVRRTEVYSGGAGQGQRTGRAQAREKSFLRHRDRRRYYLG